MKRSTFLKSFSLLSLLPWLSTKTKAEETGPLKWGDKVQWTNEYGKVQTGEVHWLRPTKKNYLYVSLYVREYTEALRENPEAPEYTLVSWGSHFNEPVLTSRLKIVKRATHFTQEQVDALLGTDTYKILPKEPKIVKPTSHRYGVWTDGENIVRDNWIVGYDPEPWKTRWK